MTDLTPAQARYLAEVRAAGPAGRRYNGRARKPLKALQAAGLVRLEFDLVPQLWGRYSELFVATAVDWPPAK
jgi:hypothetical protein